MPSKALSKPLLVPVIGHVCIFSCVSVYGNDLLQPFLAGNLLEGGLHQHLKAVAISGERNIYRIDALILVGFYFFKFRLHFRSDFGAYLPYAGFIRTGKHDNDVPVMIDDDCIGCAQYFLCFLRRYGKNDGFIVGCNLVSDADAILYLQRSN